eukprot:scaffold107306_cov30-Tisochrysis_lutea.AAC.4
MVKRKRSAKAPRADELDILLGWRVSHDSNDPGPVESSVAQRTAGPRTSPTSAENPSALEPKGVNDIREDRRPGQCEQVERGEGAHVIVLGVDLGPSHEKQIDHRNVALPGRIVEGGATILHRGDEGGGGGGVQREG